VFELSTATLTRGFIYGGENHQTRAMDTLGSRDDESGNSVGWLVERFAVADRGWKATYLGLGVAVAVAVGPL